MQLTADRLEVLANERIHAAFIVTTPMVIVLATGGVETLRRELEDVGFHDVRVSVKPPPAWKHVPHTPRPDGLEWILFAELVPGTTASLQRQLMENLRVADAWDARLDALTALPVFHPYAIAICAAARFAGALHAFATAYPLEVSYAVDATV